MDKVQPNLIMKNGAVYTVDKERSWADALAVAGDQIAYVGSFAEIEAGITSGVEVIDLEGKMVLPGFIDAHSHPSHGMDYFGNINLYPLDTLEKYQVEISQFVQGNPDALAYRGGGWSDSLFPSNGPSKEILDAIVPDRPVSIISYDGHSLWVNSVTLERAQITHETPDPAGGLIGRETETGEPNGTLRETAMDLIEGVIPEYATSERVQALIAYQAMAFGAGVTMTHDAMLDAQSIAAFKQLEAEGLLKMRFRGAITMHPDQPIDDQIQFIFEQRAENKNPRFQTNTAKIFVDGVVEGGTAYLFEPYAHRPDFSGVPIWSREQLLEVFPILDKEGIQIHVHVIGDAAAHIALDGLEKAQDENGSRDSRHMLTHLQLVTPEDISRFNQLEVIGVPNPYWFKVDEYYLTLALPYLGRDRADKQYPMKSFFDESVIMASASDFPVTIPFDPLIGIQIGMTRSEVGQKETKILWPEEKASLEQMVTSFTYNGAYANFLENETGSLVVGKQADFIVLEKNIFEIPESDIANTKVLRTYIAGKEVFRSDNDNSR
jgi:predicted amidohydrolase YtcJ